MIELGVTGDTHDLVRPELLEALTGVHAIVHVGDVCDAPTLDALADIAPVTAVRGNNDVEPFASTLPEARMVRFEQVALWLCHDANDLQRLPPPEDAALVVVGHSHKPVLEARPHFTLLNPGSPGRRRFSLPMCCARVTINGNRFTARHVHLNVPPPKQRSRRTSP